MGGAEAVDDGAAACCIPAALVLDPGPALVVLFAGRRGGDAGFVDSPAAAAALPVLSIWADSWLKMEGFPCGVWVWLWISL